MTVHSITNVSLCLHCQYLLLMDSLFLKNLHHFIRDVFILSVTAGPVLVMHSDGSLLFEDGLVQN